MQPEGGSITQPEYSSVIWWETWKSRRRVSDSGHLFSHFRFWRWVKKFRNLEKRIFVRSRTAERRTTSHGNWRRICANTLAW